MRNIAIGIACHKPFEMPQNSLFIPIHVGAALKNKPLEGMQPDNEGDNISDKNPSYCELTAQYWLWKNVDAEYYGMCHYRRFLSFAPELFDNLTDDHRGHVKVARLDERSINRYFLNNEIATQEVIQGADIVAPYEQDLSQVYTPRGNKSSVYKHFEAHDGDLINIKDLDSMVDIVHEMYPQYANDLDEYLAGKQFRGFNCFVMRRELFQELCEYEFGVLKELETRIDFTGYDTMRTRIYGFMGEIISSAFIYHVAKRGGSLVKDVQLLYFEHTDPIEDIIPRPGAIPLVINAIDSRPALVFPLLQALCERTKPEKLVDLVLLHSNEFDSGYRDMVRRVFDSAPGWTLHYMNWDVEVAALADGVTSAELFEDTPQCLLPWLLPFFDKALMLNWNVLPSENWAQLLDADMDNRFVLAALDIEGVGRNNDLYGEDRSFACDYLRLDDPLFYFNTCVVLFDCTAIRVCMALGDIAAKLESYSRQLDASQAFNVIYEHSIGCLSFEYNVQLSNSRTFEHAITDLPLAISKCYGEAKGNPIIESYSPMDPFWPDSSRHVLDYWRLARKTDAYEIIMSHVMTMRVFCGKNGRDDPRLKERIIETLLPQGSQRRALARDLIPWDSKLYSAAREIVRRLPIF